VKKILVLVVFILQARMHAAQINIDVPRYEALTQEEKTASDRMFSIILESAGMPAKEHAALIKELQELVETYPKIVNTSNSWSGVFPLIYAIHYNNYDAAEILIDAQANLNSQVIGRSWSGLETPLIAAASQLSMADLDNDYSEAKKERDLIELLVARGADPVMKNYNHRTARDRVLQASPHRVAEFDAAVHAGLEKKFQYEIRQQEAQREMEKYLLPDLVNITKGYGFSRNPVDILPSMVDEHTASAVQTNKIMQSAKKPLRKQKALASCPIQ
jgi:hypothetical protein